MVAKAGLKPVAVGLLAGLPFAAGLVKILSRFTEQMGDGGLGCPALWTGVGAAAGVGRALNAAAFDPGPDGRPVAGLTRGITPIKTGAASADNRGMRTIAFLLALPAALLAQQSQSSTAVYDINGRRVDWSQSQAGDGRTAQTQRNLNGRTIPTEKVEEKVISNEGGVRVVERTVRRFDMNGNPLPRKRWSPRQRPALTAQPWRNRRSTVTDFNGNMRPAERTVSSTHKSGNTAVTETDVERSSINGGFERVERRVAQETKDKTSSERDETVFTKDTNGRFSEAGRKVVRSKTEGGVQQEQVDEYESATSGSLKLARQSVAKVTKAADGSERREVEVFGPAAPGRAIPDGNAMQVAEKQVFTSQQSGDGSVVQVFAVQRPSVNSTKELGPLQKVSETVCQGKCQ
ncbi:MAG: hypothetical protein QM757_39195 [Paludibaculum sp.]